jgi:acyl-CoA synthetase (AMP-forming)/AMP-acid ligase II/thioesterase domain-containing protein
MPGSLSSDLVRTAALAGTAPATNVADLLLWSARQYPLTGIGLIAGESSEATVLTYSQLLHEARRILGTLQAHGYAPGAKVALLLSQPRDLLPSWWACVLGGYVPCPVTFIHNDPVRWSAHLHHIDRLLDRPLFITTHTLLPELPQSQAIDVATLRGGKSNTVKLHHARPADAAALMLTSGSTGNSKAVVLTHGNLLASMAGKAERQQLSHTDVTLNWISFDHVAALLEIHLVSTYAGTVQLHIEPGAILADPLLFLRLIDRYRVSLTFAPNFLFGQINATLEAAAVSSRNTSALTVDLSCVRHIVSGGEANVVETARCFLDLLAPYGLPRTAIRPAFGMTETCAGSIYSSDFPGCDAAREFASVGRPITGLQMRIVDADGGLAPPGEPGELQLRGTMIFDGYYNNDQATQAAFTADGWFRTGDLGRIDQGVLSLVGRSKDSIIVSGVNYFSHELEAVLERLDGVEGSFVAVFPTRPKGADTEQLVVAFAPNIPCEDEGRLHRLCVAIRNTTIALWGFRPTLVLPLAQQAIPKTSLGKIQRSLLRKQLEAGQLAAQVDFIGAVTQRQLGPYVAPDNPTEIALRDIYAQVLRIDAAPLSATANFFDLGGTSLDIFKLKRTVESRFSLNELPVAAILQNSTAQALATYITSKSTPAGADYDPIVPLQLSGSKVPLFCIHPGTGEVLVFMALASYFTNDRPFFALRARGFNPGESYFSSFEEMVATYTAAIRKRQPHGPYALAGYSFGAPVAFEIARALEADGERVAFVGSIDGTPFIGDPDHRLDFISSTVIVAFFLALIDRQQMLELPERIRAANANPCSEILRIAPATRVAELGLDLHKFEDWAALAYSLVMVGEAHIPTGTVKSATVFYAEPLRGSKHEWLNLHLRGWNGFSRMPIRYVEVPGEHNSLLGPKHVATFQALLRAEIDRALERL